MTLLKLISYFLLKRIQIPDFKGSLETMFILRRKSRYPRKLLTRLHSTDAPLASSVIRNRFIEYFVNENDHTFLRSSPIRPISDATIPFVNAGMVQVRIPNNRRQMLSNILSLYL